MSEMNRVVVVGSSGSGKTTMAREIARRLGLPYLEMDAVMHAEGWDSTPASEFLQILCDFTKADRWVVDGNYTSHGTVDVVWPRVDTVVWLDLPKRVVMSRVILRTLRRTVTRERLWDSGLREPWSNLYSRDPNKNIIVWTWTHYDQYAEGYGRTLTDHTWDHATVHRLQSQREIDRFLTFIV